MSEHQEYKCPKCHYQWETVDDPLKCPNCDFDWPELSVVLGLRTELDQLRTDNARLKSEVGALKKSVGLGERMFTEATDLNELQKAALEKAREWFYNIDVSIDDTCGSDLKQMCRDALAAINKALGEYTQSTPPTCTEK